MGPKASVLPGSRADSRTPVMGRFIEEIGYDPGTNPVTNKIDEEKALKYATGAKPSDTAKSLLQKQGIISKFAASRK